MVESYGNFGDSDLGAAATSFPKKAAKWKAAKRARALARLMRALARHRKHKKQGPAWQKRDATLRTKIAAIRAADKAAEANPAAAAQVEAAPDVPDTDTDTSDDAPEVAQPAENSAYGGIPLTYWIGGAAAAAVLAIVLARSGREPAHA
jgi:hypothetical protein